MIVTKTITIEIDTNKLQENFSLCRIPEDEDLTEEEIQEHVNALAEDAERYIREVSTDPYSIMGALDYFNY